jgi:hypothetical protein
MGGERLIPYARGFDLIDLGRSQASALGADHGGADPLGDAEARGVEFPLAQFKRFTEVCIAAMSDLTLRTEVSRVTKDNFETRWRSRWAVKTGVMEGCCLKPTWRNLATFRWVCKMYHQVQLRLVSLKI